MKKIFYLTIVFCLAFSLSGGIVDDAKVYFPFEGVDNGQGSACWQNKGTAGYCEGASRFGTENAMPIISAGGLKGSAFDSSMLTPLTAQSTVMWGEFSTTTEIEQAISGANSATICFWLKVPGYANEGNTQGRIMTSIPLEVNMIRIDPGLETEQARFVVKLSGQSFENGPNSALLASTDRWVFAAITYDSSDSGQQLKFYAGSEVDGVSFIGSIEYDAGALSGDGNIWLGNTANYQSGDRPFVGLLDEMRLFSSIGDSAGALTITELEQVRSGDIAATDYEALIKSANVYLPFEGDDDAGFDSGCWKNYGQTGFGEKASRKGSATLPTVVSGGVKGGAFDGTAHSPLTGSSSYMWGEFSSDTKMEQAFFDISSFTATFWAKVPAAYNTNNTQGRVFTTPSIEVNYVRGNLGQSNENGRLVMKLDGGAFVNGTTSSDYALTDTWRFIAVSYDGNKSSNQLNFYAADNDGELVYQGSVDYDAGKLLRTGYGGNFWLANLANVETGNRPFVGLLDEFRFFSSADSSAALMYDQIAAIKDYDTTQLDFDSLVADAGIYLSFDGGLNTDNLFMSSAYRNKGKTGTGESISRIGNQSADLSETLADGLFGEGNYPTITSVGLKGSAYDGSTLPGMATTNTFVWGEFSSDTFMEEVLKDMLSFTFTTWVSTDAKTAQGRLFVTPSMWLNYIVTDTTAKLQVDIEGVGFSSTYDLGRFDSVGKWLFVALTYDGAKTEDNAAFYVADENGVVILDTVATCDRGVIESIGYGGNLYFANTGGTGNRPFVGYLDETRFWSSKTNSGAALNINELEMVRQYDLGLVGCSGEYLTGDVNKDCIVDQQDLLLLVEDWLISN